MPSMVRQSMGFSPNDPRDAIGLRLQLTRQLRQRNLITTFAAPGDFWSASIAGSLSCELRDQLRPH